MKNNLKSISTVGMPHDEWLEHRRNAIGGSDAATLVGCNAYSSPYTVWADKLGKIPPKEDNEAMRQGRDLEDYVAQRFAEQTGKKVRNDNRIIYNPKYPFAHANIDRKVVGEDAGLECKTTSTLNIGKFKDGKYPENYYVQAMHYMMVTGCKKWYIAVLVYSVGFFVYEIDRDEAEIKALAEAESNFFNNYVKTGTPPPADGSSATTDTINAINSEAEDFDVDLTPVSKALHRLGELTEEKHRTDEQIEACKNEIKSYMGKASKGFVGNWRVNWSASSTSRLDKKKLMQDHPEIDFSKYMRTTKTRRFTFSNKE